MFTLVTFLFVICIQRAIVKRTGVCGKKNVMIILFGIQMTIIIHLHKSNNGDKKVEVYEENIKLLKLQGVKFENGLTVE